MLCGVVQSSNFCGRLIAELLSQTDPRKTVYVKALQGWYDAQDKEVVGIRTFDLLNHALSVFGLAGLDRLLCFILVRNLQLFVRFYRKLFAEHNSLKPFLQELTQLLTPTSSFPVTADKLYKAALSKVGPNLGDLCGMFDCLSLSIYLHVSHSLSFFLLCSPVVLLLLCRCVVQR